MKQLILIVTIALLAATAPAQEKVSSEEVHRIAGRLLEQHSQTKNAQVKVDADANKAAGFKGGDGGVLLILDKKLSAELLEKATAEIVPVGQLWMLKIVPANDGKATPNNKLRILTVGPDDKQVKLPLFLLGARKKAEQLELVIFGKDKEPLILIPLTKSESAGDGAVDVSGEKRGEGSGELTFKLLGKYQAKLMVTQQAD